MTPTEVARILGGHLHLPESAAERDIGRVYAGDRISDLIEHAGPDALLVTNIANAQLIRVAELVGVCAVCVAGGVEPPADLLLAAKGSGTPLISSPLGLYETCGILYRRLGR